MNGQISFGQLIAFIRSLSGMTTWQRIQLVCYTVGAGVLAGAAAKDLHEMIALGGPAALVAAIGYVHALAQPPTVGSHVDAQGRTHL